MDKTRQFLIKMGNSETKVVEDGYSIGKSSFSSFSTDKSFVSAKEPAVSTVPKELPGEPSVKDYLSTCVPMEIDHNQTATSTKPDKTFTPESSFDYYIYNADKLKMKLSKSSLTAEDYFEIISKFIEPINNFPQHVLHFEYSSKLYMNLIRMVTGYDYLVPDEIGIVNVNGLIKTIDGNISLLMTTIPNSDELFFGFDLNQYILYCPSYFNLTTIIESVPCDKLYLPFTYYISSKEQYTTCLVIDKASHNIVLLDPMGVYFDYGSSGMVDGYLNSYFNEFKVYMDFEYLPISIWNSSKFTMTDRPGDKVSHRETSKYTDRQILVYMLIVIMHFSGYSAIDTFEKVSKMSTDELYNVIYSGYNFVANVIA